MITADTRRKTAGSVELTPYNWLASNCRNADWLGALCVLYDGDAPSVRAGGAPSTRMMFVPVAETDLLDTWHTSGLCGTASDDFAWHEAFVPDAHVADLFGGAGIRRWPGASRSACASR